MLTVTITYSHIPGGRPAYHRYTTHGDWFIEGNFIITFDKDGNKSAHALPEYTRRISEEKTNASR